MLERFGPDLLPGLAELLAACPDPGPGWVLYAHLAAVHRPPEALDKVEPLLHHPDPEHRSAALGALAAIDLRAGGIRGQALAKDPPTDVRLQAARALGTSGDPLALPYLRGLLEDPCFEVRRAASRSLAALGPEGAQALLGCMGDPLADPLAKDMAREALDRLDRQGAP